MFEGLPVILALELLLLDSEQEEVLWSRRDRE